MRNPAFNKVVDEILKLHEKKNKDYGTQRNPLNNLTACERLGLNSTTGIVVRLQDKWARIENFYLNGKLENESLRDAFIDNAIYSLLAVTILDAGASGLKPPKMKKKSTRSIIIESKKKLLRHKPECIEGLKNK